MCAYDVRIAAPEARILDYALLQSTGPTWTAFLSDGIAAFADLIDLLSRQPGPLVVTSSVQSEMDRSARRSPGQED
jgi:hypothetical protein